MKKLVCILIEKIKSGTRTDKRFRLFEKCANTFLPAADPELRPGVVDDSGTLKVITGSVQFIPDGVDIIFSLPEGFDRKRFFPLKGRNLRTARRQLGLPPIIKDNRRALNF
jgi:hypothetical protein